MRQKRSPGEWKCGYDLIIIDKYRHKENICSYDTYHLHEKLIHVFYELV